MTEVVVSSGGKKTIFIRPLMLLVLGCLALCTGMEVSLNNLNSFAQEAEKVTGDELAREKIILTSKKSSGDKFSAILGSSSISLPFIPFPITKEKVPQGTKAQEKPSLWGTLRANFYQNRPSATEGIKSAFSPVKVKAFLKPWEEVLAKMTSDPHNSTEGSRGPRQSPSLFGPVDTVAWESAKVMGGLGKDLLSHMWGRYVIQDNRKSSSVYNALLKPFEEAYRFKLGMWDLYKRKSRDLAKVYLNYQQGKLDNFQSTVVAPNTLPKLLTGGWTQGQSQSQGQSPVVVYQGRSEESLLKRLIEAKLTIAKHLALANLRLKKDLVVDFVPAALGVIPDILSLGPTLLRIQFNLLNTVLSVIAAKDTSAIFQAVRVLNSAIWRGKTDAFRAIFGGGRQLLNSIPKPQLPPISSNYGVPAQSPIPGSYGVPAPSPTYGVPAQSPIPGSYGVPAPSPTYGVPAQPTQSYGVPTKSLPTSYGAVLRQMAALLQKGGYSASAQSPSPTFSRPFDFLKIPNILPTAPTQISDPLQAYPQFDTDSDFQNQGVFSYANQLPQNYATLPPVVATSSQQVTKVAPRPQSLSDMFPGVSTTDLKVSSTTKESVGDGELRNKLRNSIADSSSAQIPTEPEDEELVADRGLIKALLKSADGGQTDTSEKRFSSLLLQSGFNRN